ncbi:hypothetical protein F2P56_027598 [Juglans regia]|uniref:EF-hand domain-containing protein n=2 Tax=Juglans regia TaxID=51240 RepID=A0A833U7G6_JUGRE|nr:uncharacterized protein LOC108980699 [Juglans regia]KAF5452622.1 hypothetical protein F2P56_027598 [Juglans regia]
MDLSEINELRIAATASYNNAPRYLQNRAWDFFKQMDMNGDDRVSLDEYFTFFRACGYTWIDCNLFWALDLDRDGRLDFYDVLALYYFMKTRVRCRCCWDWPRRMYFTCLECFDSGGNTYDLCPNCYAREELTRFQHGRNVHGIDRNIFLDSYVLLRARRGWIPAAAPSNMSLALVPQPPPQHQPARPDWWNVLHLLDVAINGAISGAIGGVISGLCSIM